MSITSKIQDGKKHIYTNGNLQIVVLPIGASSTFWTTRLRRTNAQKQCCLRVWLFRGWIIIKLYLPLCAKLRGWHHRMSTATPALIYLDPQHEPHSKSFAVLSVDLELPKLPFNNNAAYGCSKCLFYRLENIISMTCFGKRSGQMVCVLDSGSSGLSPSPGRGTALCSWARHFNTFTVPLFTQLYKWVLANLMLRRGRLCSGLASHLVGGEKVVFI